MNAAKSLDNVSAGSRRGEGWRRYISSLKYGMYVIFHPFDGFWDLVHEQRGSLLAAHTWLFLFLLTYVMRLMLTNFQFITAPLQYINIYEQCGSLLMPFLIGLFGYYFHLSFARDSAVQKPEKLFHEKGLMLYLLVFIGLFILLMSVDIPGLAVLTDSKILSIPGT